MIKPRKFLMEEFRRNNGLALSDVAIILGVVESTAQRYEKEILEIKAVDLLRLATHYGVDLGKLVRNGA